MKLNPEFEKLESLWKTKMTLRKWVRTAEDAGEPLANGMTTSERMRQLERENKELRGTNEILKSAAAIFRGGARPPTQTMIDCIDDKKSLYGVRPICKVLPIVPSTYYAHNLKLPAYVKSGTVNLSPRSCGCGRKAGADTVQERFITS